MSRTLSLTNSKDIIANTISLIIGNRVVNLVDLFLTKDSSINDMFNLAPGNLDTIAEIAAAINNDSHVFGKIQNLLALKASLIYVDAELQKKSDWTEIHTKNQIYSLLQLKSDKK